MLLSQHILMKNCPNNLLTHSLLFRWALIAALLWFAPAAFAGIPLNWKYCAQANGYMGDVYRVHPVVTFEALQDVPDGTYFVTCTSSDEYGQTIEASFGGFGHYWWRVELDVAGGQITATRTWDTSDFWGNAGFSIGTLSSCPVEMDAGTNQRGWTGQRC